MNIEQKPSFAIPRIIIFPAIVIILSFLLANCGADGAYGPPERWDCLNGEDTDCDGFLNNVEAYGFSSYCGNFNSQSGSSQSDSTKQTLFYIYTEEGNTNNPAPIDAEERLAYLTTDHGDDDTGGLNFEVHQIEFAEENDGIPIIDDDYRRVSEVSEQKAIYLIEDTDETLEGGEVLGSVLSYGIPQVPNYNYATIYTNRIRELIDSECGSGFADSPIGDDTVCKTEDGKTGVALFKDFSQHVFAHEAAHMFKPLSDVDPPVYRKYGYHTAPGAGYILDVSVEYKYSRKDDVTTFYIYNDFSYGDYDQLRLVPYD